MEPKSSEHIEYKAAHGVTFKIRGSATRRDQSQMNLAISDGVGIEEGKIIRGNPLRVYPWLIERFVIGWSGGPQSNGREILNALYEEPADPKEDLVMVLGAYILNHVKGLSVGPDDESKKKG
jgi:hypothetical protein